MKTILIVEDEPWLAQAYCQALQQAGYRVATSRTAEAAIVDIDQHHPDLIVLDMLLPGANGLQLVHEVRSHHDLLHVPVIVCSSTRLPFTDEQLLAYGVVRNLPKASVTPKVLLRAVKEALA